MTAAQIAALRLQNQRIKSPEPASPEALAEHMGALQAQDFQMSKWAVGLRLPSASALQIEAALDAGRLVRTHVLRPTWHLVSGRDARWMLALSSRQIRATMAARDRDLGLDAAIYARANGLIARALEGQKQLTRAEIMLELERGGVATDPSRAVHFMIFAETEALVCNGKPRGVEQTYALLDEKVVEKGPVFSRSEAVAELARRYFSSHGPATLHDFQWWSGLPMGDARAGLEAIKSGLGSAIWSEKAYFFEEKLAEKNGASAAAKSAFWLPAFDEFTVAYRDRSAVFDPRWHGEAITSNGIFRPVLVADGQVVGTWKRALRKGKVLLEPAFFDSKNAPSLEIFEEQARRFGAFLSLEPEVLNGF